jgi:SAM-dependent methyltransferase
MRDWILSMGRRLLPVSTRRKIARLTSWPPVGLVRFGNLRRLKPISTQWGMERGKPIDRYYIEGFLAAHKDDIRGRVLEIANNTYTYQFGQDKVSESDVLHVDGHNEHVTIIGDLTDHTTIPTNAFDCLIITQTLQYIFDLQSAVKSIYLSLKPGGVALVTIPGINKICRYEMDRWGYFWSFSTLSAKRLFEAVFPAANVKIVAHGNVLAAIAFLHGLAVEELKQDELDYHDKDFELLITVRAVKPTQA